MVKRIVLLAAVAGAAWSVHTLRPGDTSLLVSRVLGAFDHSQPTESSIAKCVTESGEVIYGLVPPGTHCRTLQPVETAPVLGAHRESRLDPNSGNASAAAQALATIETGFKCDGRTRCSQMRSCEEATFFVIHCPGVKMDGNHDGIPCERQWCN